MLTALSIRDIVLIDTLDMNFSQGLCALTGETGAGKSILLDSLGLALGARADGGLVASGAQRGSVTAVFDIPAGHPARNLLAEQDLEGGEELILRRVQMCDGRTRAYINDQQVSVSLLRAVGGTLVEIHGQHDERGLLDRRGHRLLLDNFGVPEDVRVQVRTCWETWQESRNALQTHQDRLLKALQEKDFLSHAIDELDTLDPCEGEDERLAQERSFLMHAEKTGAELDEAHTALSGDQGMEARVNLALKRLERAAPRAGGRLDAVVAALERTLIEISEARRLLADARATIEANPDKLEQTEERLFTLREVARKYNVEVEALAALREEMRAQLETVNAGETQVQTLEAAVRAAQTAYEDAAGRLSEVRRQAACALDEAVALELAPLKLDKAEFCTRLEKKGLEAGGPDGVDAVSFLVSTNPGAALGPLMKIASGGELSRFVLALKTVLMTSGHTPTMIFDEADSGVGGAVAEAVGIRLAELAASSQVLVVTHSPQVAARAHMHFQVSKHTASGDAVMTRVDVLGKKGRREEIARMLAGATITDEARAAADQLLGSAA